MKKLMVAFVAVAMAMAASAGTANWKTAKSAGVIYGPETSAALASGTAYLFLASAAETVFTDWANGTALADMTSLDNNSIAAGKITTKDGISLASGEFSAIIATSVTIGDKDYLFISDPASATVPDGPGNVTLNFAATAASQAAVMDAGAGYQGAGWYAVPEPTSGLLMLLGMGALALRRRRA